MTLRRGYVDTSWGQVHYLEHGEGPVCAFFHESPQSVQAFEQTLPHMTGIRAIAFDTPGYGNSDPPPEDGFEIPDYSARLLEAIDGLGMLLHQAVPGFERWFGVRPSVTEALRTHVLAGGETS